ncbi:putative membrane protein, TIGR04086 family [Clostridium cavendishii DSM 21758]|uniref:Putative membrane protein, TIGR04086 family n=1 Tax=Clostridium cavendishii DSM 21758 TaxID=1121302 RepID=A0A1M6ABF3_9CLOT|nr:TIGR04086 family membrane protein [Clostridium cavendishii]SHI33791.1 putative membrane protein, TIGR04086 family [Clostridium cavendishii DSM 21758]
MNWSSCFINVTKGLLRGLILTLICVLAISLVMSFKDLGSSVLGVLWVITTCVSIFIGATYAAKRNGEKGWLVGLILAIVYYLVIMIISSIFRGEIHLGIMDGARLLIAMAIGLLSGMLGINI